MTKEIAKAEATYSQRFTNAVVKEFSGTVGGGLHLTQYQERLAQHMFIGIDAQLKNLEVKRLEKNKGGLPIVWANIDMNKLAIDAMHRVELGLDALIPNHIHPIPYFNKATKKYALDLRIGYAGKDCYRRKMATDEPVDIVYELVCENDTFKPIKRGKGNDIESYEFEISNPFDRGEIVGGFGYIMYDDLRKNQLVIVTKKDFDKAKNYAQSNTFWEAHPEQMMFKTLVHRTVEKLGIDPEKVNASFLHVEIDDTAAASERVIEEKANKTPVDIDEDKAVDAEFEVNDEPGAPDTQPPDEPPHAAEAAKQATGSDVPAPDDLEWG